MAVDGNNIANAPGHRHFHAITEVVDNRRITRQAPIAKNPDKVAIHDKRFALLDDQRSSQTSANLLGTVVMRVVPIGASIRNIEFVGKCLPGGDRLLGQKRHAIHCIRHPHAMPMHCRCLR